VFAGHGMNYLVKPGATAARSTSGSSRACCSKALFVLLADGNPSITPCLAAYISQFRAQNCSGQEMPVSARHNGASTEPLVSIALCEKMDVSEDAPLGQ
jgi:hypothetical protein